MSDAPGSRLDEIDRILAEYLQSVEAGRPSSRAELRNRHPELAKDLEQYFADEDRLGGAIARLKEPVQPETGVWRRSDAEQSTLDADRVASEATIAPDGNQPVDATLGKVRYFGDYELLQEIARGGMGVVYKARQVSLNRIVALKMILAGNLASETDVQRFRTEAEAAANLDHPNIVPIYEVGEHEGQHYFSMKFIDGGNVAEHVSRFVTDQKAAAQLIATVARAVHHAHQRGILHRDLKPGNILLSVRSAPIHRGHLTTGPDESGHYEPHITDFGLAKRVTADTAQTRTGAIVGTPSYMAPEQARAEKSLTTAVDVYSLGAILYELLTGRPPFKADTPLDTVLQLLDRDPTRPRSINSSADVDLETICLKCLEKEPKNRYGSACELADDLERFLAGEPIRARPPGPIGRLRRWSRKHPALAVTWAAVGGFYLNHMVLLWLGAAGEGGGYHRSVTVLVAAWMIGAAGFEYLGYAHAGRRAALVSYGWTAMDVVLFTAYLLIGSGPRSSLISGYLVLVAGTPLRGGVRLVWFATALIIGSYLALELFALNFDTARAVPIYQAVIFVLGIVVVGLIQHLLLRRLPPDPTAVDGSSATGPPRIPST